MNELSDQRSRLEDLDKIIRQRNKVFDSAEETLAGQLKDFSEKVRSLEEAVEKTKATPEREKKLRSLTNRVRRGVWATFFLVLVAMLFGFAQFCWMSDRLETITVKIDQLFTAAESNDRCKAEPCQAPEIYLVNPCCGCDRNDAPPSHKPRKKRSPYSSNGCIGSGVHDKHMVPPNACTCHAAMTTCRPMPVKCCAQQLEPLKADSARMAVPAGVQVP
ncbi:MAG: hypothetical protein JNJ91_06070 [Flavobacteriales bacterium]|nr:hypothetical protein [Flavobacteriales bacterium]